jgi:iron-sulfur cluster repair protein YtfE (RIC family)
MAVQIGAKPDSGFDDPIGMLKDCHRRIERFLGILCQVVHEARGRALTAEECQAVEAALHYFRESGPRHNTDEEESLFPRLRSLGAAQVLEQVRCLESDHRETSALHEVADLLYSKWIAEGRLGRGEEALLFSIVREIQRMYIEHIRLEEDTVFPCAADLLAPNALAAMGAEFAARRR